jgi:putative endonuclease
MPTMPKPDRRNYDHGHQAEFLCRLALRLKGYQILAARYRTPLGEIDIVASRGNIIAVIEVKARTNKPISIAPRNIAGAATGARHRHTALRPHAGSTPPLAGTYPIRLGWRVKNFMPYRPSALTPPSAVSASHDQNHQ